MMLLIACFMLGYGFHLPSAFCFQDIYRQRCRLPSKDAMNSCKRSTRRCSSGKGFGRPNDGKGDELEKKFGKNSEKILSIPSMDELSNRNEVTDLKVLSSMYENAKGDDGQKKVFEDVVKFPTQFPLKVIAENSPKFEEEVVSTVANALANVREKSQVPMADWESKIESSRRNTSGGKFISVTLKPYFRNADELYLVYETIKNIKGVKYCI